MTTRYHTMTDLTHAAAILSMVDALYAEGSCAVRPPNPMLTIKHLLQNPERGRIIMMMRDTRLCGYAILIPYWSNEFGGNILFVDELYVVAEARSQGSARGLFDLIERERPFDAVSIFLEVSPSNARARRFYESIGMMPRTYNTMVRKLPSDGSRR